MKPSTNMPIKNTFIPTVVQSLARLLVTLASEDRPGDGKVVQPQKLALLGGIALGFTAGGLLTVLGVLFWISIPLGLISLALGFVGAGALTFWCCCLLMAQRGE